jgi:hypothetical protein
MNDRRFPVPYGLLAGLSPATSLHWAAMMNASHALLGGMCPMVAPNYAATRSALAKSIGLGRKAAAPPPAAAVQNGLLVRWPRRRLRCQSSHPRRKSARHLPKPDGLHLVEVPAYRGSERGEFSPFGKVCRSAPLSSGLGQH